MKAQTRILDFADHKLHQKKLKRFYLWRFVWTVFPAICLLWSDISGQLRIITPVLILLPLFDLHNQLNIWRLHNRYFGIPPLEVIQEMWKLDAWRGYVNSNVKNANRGSVFEFAFWFVLFTMGLWVAGFVLNATVLLYIGTISGMLAIKAVIRLGRPPDILFLSASSIESSELQLHIQYTIHPLDVVSLLYHQDTASPAFDIALHFFSFRTADDAVWQNAVRILMKACPIIVIDIRTATEPVQFEIDLALQTLPLNPDRLLFVGEAPTQSAIPTELCVTQFELISKLRERFPNNSPMVDYKSMKSAVYLDTRNHYFSITPPQGWMFKEFDDSRSKVTFAHPTIPELQLHFNVREALLHQVDLNDMKTMADLEKIGFQCSLERTMFQGVPCNEVTAIPTKREEFAKLYKFYTQELLFVIVYSAPTQALFDKYLEEVQKSLHTLIILKNTPTDVTKAEDQLIQREIRFAKLMAQDVNIDEAKRILMKNSLQHPENQQIRETLNDLIHMENKED